MFDWVKRLTKAEKYTSEQNAKILAPLQLYFDRSMELFPSTSRVVTTVSFVTNSNICSESLTLLLRTQKLDCETKCQKASKALKNYKTITNFYYNKLHGRLLCFLSWMLFTFLCSRIFWASRIFWPTTIKIWFGQ